MKINVHTRYDTEKDIWYNKEVNKINSFSVDSLKTEAVKKGRERAIANKSEHIIHDKKGLISERNSYGNDPHPPKG